MSQAKAIIVHFVLSFARPRMHGITTKVDITRACEACDSTNILFFLTLLFIHVW